MNNELIERIDAIIKPFEGLKFPAPEIRTLRDCKAALTQQQQEAEPVAWLCAGADGRVDAATTTYQRDTYARVGREILPLYLHPPKPAAQSATMDDAIAAGDGTLHGAIDYWQERALRAEAAQPQVPESRNIRSVDLHGDQSVIVSFPSCRSASAFARWLSAAKEES